MKRFVEFPDGSTFLLSSIEGFHIFELTHSMTIYVNGQLYGHSFPSVDLLLKFVKNFKEDWMFNRMPSEDIKSDIGNLMVKLDRVLENLT